LARLPDRISVEQGCARRWLWGCRRRSVGIVGAMIGDGLLPRFNIRFVGGVMGLAVDATIGAVVLLLVLRSVGASGWGGAR
jgi:Transglycosylase associated protein